MIENSVSIIGQAISVILGMFSTYIIFYFMSHIERNIYYKKYVYLIFYIVFTIIIFCSAIFIGGISNLLINIIVTIIFGHYLFNSKKIYAFYYAIYMVMIFLVQTIISVSFELIAYTFKLTFYNLEVYLNTVSLITQFIVLGLSRLLIIYFNNKKIKRFTIVQYLNFLILPLFSVFYIVSLTLYIQMYMTIGDIVLLIINIVLIIILNIFITNVFESISKNNELQNQLKLYEQKSQMEFKYYETLNDKYNNSRKIIHDMKNHLQTIECLYKEKEVDKAKEYTKDMYLMLDKLYQKKYSENKVLNIILNDKFLKAEAFNIKVKSSIGDVDLDFIKDIDLTTIFSNILDNAIEASIESNKNKSITLKVDSFNDFIVINLSNYTEKPPIRDKGKFKTTKKEHSGLGIENVRMTLKKYDGTLRTKYEESIFKVNIIIPINM